MTDVLTTPDTTSAARSAVQTWLDDFDRALSAGDVDAASALFGEDSYWRDLIAFTWNIKTVEGPAGVADLLAATLAHVHPSGWRITDDEEPTAADGVTEAWIEFETAAGRGPSTGPTASARPGSRSASGRRGSSGTRPSPMS